MKKLISCCFFLVIALSSSAQEAQLPLVQEKLQALQWLEGDWKGSGWMMNRQGERLPFEQREFIRYWLNNTILHIEGLGTHAEDTVHHALAIVSYEPQGQQYRFTSYTATGGSQHDAQVEVKPNTLIWKMLTPRGSIRYTIVLNEKGQWYEIGEFSADQENSWSKFFEMTLDRVSEKTSISRK